MSRGIYDRTKPKSRLAPVESYSTPAANASARIKWSENEIKLIAAEWVLLRSIDPFETPLALFEKAQRKVLTGDRQRSLGSVKTNQNLYSEICSQWKAFLENPHHIEPETPVQIVTIEIPRKLSFQEMLKEIDEPGLEALLSAKRIGRENTFHELLAAIAAHAGASNLPNIPPFAPKMEAFAPAKCGPRRIAIIGAPAASGIELPKQVKEAGLNAILTFPLGKDTTTLNRCDYAIICRTNGHHINGFANSQDSDRAIGVMGRDHVVILDDAKEGQLLQRVRDLCARQ